MGAPGPEASLALMVTGGRFRFLLPASKLPPLQVASHPHRPLLSLPGSLTDLGVRGFENRDSNG